MHTCRTFLSDVPSNKKRVIRTTQKGSSKSGKSTSLSVNTLLYFTWSSSYHINQLKGNPAFPGFWRSCSWTFWHFTLQSDHCIPLTGFHITWDLPSGKWCEYIYSCHLLFFLSPKLSIKVTMLMDWKSSYL